jgi:predicted permease
VEDEMLQDLRYGVRVLFKSKMITLVAVVSLGLGIGATSTIYALTDQLLIHNVTAREPERLVRVGWGSWSSYPNYRDIRDSGVFADLAANAMCYPEPRWREGDQTHAIAASCVSGNFFAVMGVQAARGRVFTDDEAAAEKNPRVVVISHQFWQQRLAGDPDVIGRVLTLNHTGYTILGVLPADYRGNYGRPPEVIVLFSTVLYPRLFERDSATMDYIGRLAPGRTIVQTQQALLAVLRGLERQFPEKVKLKQEPVPELMPVVGMARFGKKSWDFKFSAMLGAIGVLILLIGCANVAGLLLARGVARRREIATRLAVGATKLRLIRQLLVETAMIAAAGAAAGVGLAFLTADILRKVSLRGEAIHFQFTPDWRFAGAAAALAVIATFVSGLVPALASSRINLADTMRASQSAMPRLRLRSTLASAQLACSVILVFGAFVLVLNLVHVLRFDPGFDTAHTLQFDLTTTDLKIYPVALREQVYRELESQRRRLGGGFEVRIA